MKNTITRVDALNFAIDELSKGGQVDTEYTEVVEILAKIRDQIAKPHKTSEDTKARAKAKRANERAVLMAKVLPVLRDALSKYEVGVTAKELYANCADKLPEDFTALKVQAVLLREMKDEIVKTETKGKPNLYEIKRG